MGTAVAGFLGALIGACASLFGLVVQQHYQTKRERMKIAADHGLKVNEEINRALKTIRLNQNYEEEWTPTPPNIFEATNELLTREFLFVEKNVVRALNLFLAIMADTVYWEPEVDMGVTLRDKDRMIKEAYEQLKYISEHVTDFLRTEIFVGKINKPALISKLALLQLCIFISRSEFKSIEFPNQNIIKVNGTQSPIDIVKIAENNTTLFKNELVNFFKSIKEKYKNDNNFMIEVANAEKSIRDI